MAWKHSAQNKESRTQKDVNDYLKRKTDEQENIMMKINLSKKKEQANKDSDKFLARGKKLQEKYESKMTNNAIADHNKQHKGTHNEIKTVIAKKMLK